MQERIDAGKDGHRTVRMQVIVGDNGWWTGGTQGRRNAGQDRRNAGHEGCRSGWMQERRKTGKMGAEHGKKIILSCVETFVTFYAKTCNIYTF